jgi:hypothetical protein
VTVCQQLNSYNRESNHYKRRNTRTTEKDIKLPRDSLCKVQHPPPPHISYTARVPLSQYPDCRNLVWKRSILEWIGKGTSIWQKILGVVENVYNTSTFIIQAYHSQNKNALCKTPGTWRLLTLLHWLQTVTTLSFVNWQSGFRFHLTALPFAGHTNCSAAHFLHNVARVHLSIVNSAVLSPT